MAFKLALITFLVFSPVFAKTKKKTQKKHGQNDQNFVDKTHDLFSRHILSFSESIDQFFSDQRSTDVVNNSQLKISTITRKFETKDPATIGNLQYNLVLPRTQKKLQLFVEGQGSNNQDEAQATNNNTVNQKNGQQLSNATTAGLRYITETAGIETSTDAGIRLNIPPQLFGRLKLRKDIKLNLDWTFRPREQVLWVDREGFSSTTNLDFDNKLNIDLLLRLVNRMDWSESDYAITFTNGPSLFHKIDDTKGFTYNAFIISLNQPDLAVENYVINMSYRQLLYKNWLFTELTPQIDFDRENNFHRRPSFSFEFEIILGNI